SPGAACMWTAGCSGRRTTLRIAPRTIALGLISLVAAVALALSATSGEAQESELLIETSSMSGPAGGGYPITILTFYPEDHDILGVTFAGVPVTYEWPTYKKGVFDGE